MHSNMELAYTKLAKEYLAGLLVSLTPLMPNPLNITNPPVPEKIDHCKKMFCQNYVSRIH